MEKEIIAEDYINLMRKIAWSFHNTTGLPFEDLLSASFECFVHARKSYDPEKGAFSTYLYYTCRSSLINYCHSTYQMTEHHRQPSTPFLWEASHLLSEQVDYQDPEKICILRETLQTMPEEAKMIAKMVLESPAEFLACGDRPKLSRGAVKDKLRSMGWPWSLIWKGFRDLKYTLSQTG